MILSASDWKSVSGGESGDQDPSMLRAGRGRPLRRLGSGQVHTIGVGVRILSPRRTGTNPTPSRVFIEFVKLRYFEKWFVRHNG